MTTARRRAENDQGQGGQVRRPPLHRHPRQGAARLGARQGVRRTTSSSTATCSTARRSRAGRASRPRTCCCCPIRTPPTSIRSWTRRRSTSPATSSSRPTARATSAIRARSPSAPRRTSSPRASATSRISDPSPNSSSSTPSSGRSTCRAATARSSRAEAPWSTAEKFEGGNMGHRPTVKGGYFPVPPVDSLQDIRSAMCLALEQMGVEVEVHHHEVATAGQCEIGTKFAPLVQARRLAADPEVRRAQHGARVRQDGDVHAEADRRRQRLGHARAPVDLEGRQEPVRRRQATPACPTSRCTTSAASSSTRRR